MYRCKCGVPYRHESLDLELGLGQCLACGEISALTVASASQAAEPLDKPKALAARPASWVLREEAGGVLLAKTWETPGTPLMLRLAMLWNAASATRLIYEVLSHGFSGFIFLRSPMVLGGLGFGYYWLAMSQNRTELRLRGGQLTLSFGPLPWWGARTLRASEVRQAYVRSESVPPGKPGSWTVRLIGADGRQTPLLTGLPDEEEARYVEQQLERVLGIQDVAVVGEGR